MSNLETESSNGTPDIGADKNRSLWPPIVLAIVAAAGPIALPSNPGYYREISDVYVNSGAGEAVQKAIGPSADGVDEWNQLVGLPRLSSEERARLRQAHWVLD